MSNPLQQPLMQVLRTIVAAKPLLIDTIGNEAINFIDDNFDRSGFQGETFQPWPKRKKAEKGKSRKLMVDTATLRRSFKQTNGANSTTISTDVPYAQVHNEGGNIKMPSRSIVMNYSSKDGRLRLSRVRTQEQQRKITTIRRASIGAHNFNMTKRQFIGPSPVLNRRCEAAILTILTMKLNNIN